MEKRWSKQAMISLAIAMVTYLLWELGARLFAEINWFQELGFGQIFWQRLSLQITIAGVVFTFSLLFLWGNLRLANYLSSPTKPENIYSPPIYLTTLLPLVIILAVILLLRLIHYSILLVDLQQVTTLPPLPTPFEFDFLQGNLAQLLKHSPILGALIIATIVFLARPIWLMNGIAIGQSILFTAILSAQWGRIFLWTHPSKFLETDPLFGNDIGFYVFTLPGLQLVDFWFEGLCFFALIGVTFTYILANDSLSEGKFVGFSLQQLRHLWIIAGLFMFALSFNHWLKRYELLYSQQGVVSFGAGFTDIHINLPAANLLMIFTAGTGLWLFFQGIWGTSHREPDRDHQPTEVKLIFSYVLLLALSVGLAYGVQRLNVQPNELDKESPYLARSIEYTRKGFALQNIETKVFDPEDKLTEQDILDNYLTVDNIRLWDSRPILRTNRQLQQLRLYYSFPDADVDRYYFSRNPLTNEAAKAGLEERQIIISARELNYPSVPERAQTWVNEHLVYTHGYGFTMSPVHNVDDNGLPYYYVQDISNNEDDTLETMSDTVKEAIAIKNPRIYYGELTNTYIMTPSAVEEFDYPRGETNVYNTYDGRGGSRLGIWPRRLLWSQYFKDVRMLFANNLTPETKILFRRNINDRLQAIAPFLRYDQNPYLVVATADPDNNTNMYWVVDAYTSTDHYPYADGGDNGFNYMRNSVKIIIDAYNGDIELYVADPKDPIIQSWQRIFPSLFKPISTMPQTLQTHLRYPEEFFGVQSERLLAYHMTDVQVFYNKEDQWEIPQEIYNNETQSIDPYYLIMKFPNEDDEEFIILHPYTPISRPNLIAWLAGRSDGDRYGKLLLYQFPKQKLVYGPDQVEALINQDPVISQQISLWDNAGSSVIQGNLLVIPIDQSLLYVEPIYLEAERQSLPTLTRVIVVYENKIVMAKSVEQALNTIFSNEETPSGEDSPIIRSLSDPKLIPEGL